MSTPSIRGRALTRAGRSTNAGCTLIAPAHSSRVMADTDSMPLRRFSHSWSMPLAPGNLPPIPITSISGPVTSFDVSIGRRPLAFAAFLPQLTAVRAARERRVRRGSGLDDPTQGAHAGRFEERRRRQLHGILLLYPAHEMHGEERGATELEEVVVGPPPVDSQQFRPERGEPALYRVLGGDVHCAQVGPRVPL